jgi:hypothetical protein
MSRVRSIVSGALVLVIASFALDAAGEAADALAAGRSLWRSFEYEDAIVQLQAVLNDPSASAAQRLEALELMSVLHLTLRRDAQAQETFVRLLNLDPGHNLTDPGYPPRVQEFYANARRAFIPQISIEIEPVVPSAIPDSGTLALTAVISGDSQGVERALAFVRTAGETSYRRALMRRQDGNEFTADVPTPPQGRDLEYYFEVQAPSGHVLGRLGSDSDPRTLAASGSAPPPGSAWSSTPSPGTATPPTTEQPDTTETPRVSRPWYRTWWFWTIVGGVVVTGTAVGLGVGLQEDVEPGTLGRIELP